MENIDFNYNEVAYKATKALETWGYECECKVESRGVIAIIVYSRNGVELDSQKRIFRLCANEDLTRSSLFRHRHNYYEWREGLAKLSSPDFWLRRGGDVRGALSDTELVYQRQYNESHREERVLYDAAYHTLHREEKAAYHASHREERIAYMADYNDAHRDELAAYNAKRYSQLWTNGTETIKWSTLMNRGRKADLIAQGWHPIS